MLRPGLRGPTLEASWRAWEAQTAAAILGHNFPDGQWYKDAFSLLQTGGLEPQENAGSWMSKLFKKVSFG